MTGKGKQKLGDCNLCDGPNEKDDMVECDSCKKWMHYGCAGVDASVSNRSYSCEKCVGASKEADETVLTVVGARTPSKLGTSSSKSVRSKLSHQKVDLELKKLEEENKLEVRFLQEKMEKQKEYLQRKYELLKCQDEGESEAASSQHNFNHVTNWVHKSTLSVLPQRETQFEVQQKSEVPNYQQIASRKGLAKQLPVFTGRAEEWPVFISHYETSTELCNYSNAENLLRLQTALKGKAYDAVKNDLLHPNKVPEVISILHDLFGMPEHIIEDLIKKVKAEPPPRVEKLDTIISYALLVRSLSSTMEATGLSDHLTSPLLLKLVVDKLPATMRLEWAMSIPVGEKSNIREFGKWLFRRAQAASTITRYGGDEGKVDKRVRHLNAHAEKSQARGIGTCYACDQNHRIVDCDVFAKLDCGDRWKIVNEKALCVCLRHPKRYKCKTQTECSKNGCKAKHHSLLHDYKSVSDSGTCNTHQRHDRQEAWFRIIPVTLYGKGKSVETFAFIDCGSSLTLMEENISQMLQLKGVPKSLCLKWTADTTRLEQGSEEVPVYISGQSCDKKYFLQGVRTVKSLDLPMQSLDPKQLIGKYPHLKGLPLQAYKQARCGILIGLNNENVSIALKVREGMWNEPVAVKTRLGWCLSGGDSNVANVSGVYHTYEACECDLSLHELVEQNFALENSEIVKNFVDSAIEERGKNILATTTRRVGKRYECGLLWKYDVFDVPESYQMALKRLHCLERKMDKDPAIASNIKKQINNLIQKGYARKCDQQEIEEHHPRTWYLPTFIVSNPNKPEKIRLVWDAAASVKGVSLNTMLLKGPDQLKALTDVLFGFRVGKVAIAGDIQEMFHQIRVRKEDQRCQRFLWRDSKKDSNPDVYQMQVLTFGASCSPSIAQHVKNVNAKEFADEYPRAAEAIIEHHYVDDLLDSVETIEEAIQLAKDVRYVHLQAGFVMRNWQSNSIEVMRAIGESLTSEERTLDRINNDSFTKVLGLWWNPNSDVFTFSLKYVKSQEDILLRNKMPTKRELLRILMSIFDPLGFLSFYLVRLKVLLQEVWRIKIEWDEVIHGQLQEKWESWRQLLANVENIKIPRCYSTFNFKKDLSIQLHVFVDASEEAMAAVAYLRFCNGDSVECSIVSAKSKVAPLQPMSIPRMELQAALIGSRMARQITNGHKFKFEKRVFWTDSKNVLQWLRTDAKQFKQFVMFRVGKIQKNTESCEWRWVPTKLNVADEATKWSKVPSFDSDCRWFKGPSFLYEHEDKWPLEMSMKPNDSSREEMRPKYLLAIGKKEVDTRPLINFDRFIKWERLQRAVAWIIRYVNNLRRIVKKESLATGPLSTEELHSALVVIWKTAQDEEYKIEITTLRCGKMLPKTSKLYKYSPNFDEDGVLRLMGRIDYADFVEESVKHPVLLSRQSRVSFLIIDKYHRDFKHACNATVINEARQKFCIPGMKNLLKDVRRKCRRCRITRTLPKYPEMAPLPKARLGAFQRPFTFVGVDYFGPIEVTVGRSTAKRWGVLFTCLTIRAVHIEVAHTLTTDSCIMCIRNFMSRRGTPKEIYSDNGTNFIGAEKELKKAFKSINKEAILEKFTTHETRWYFNPPSAPHMGGSWERLVGSVKKVLREVVQNQRLNDETLLSTLIEIEGIINTRPLTDVSVNFEDGEALTPNHFLLKSSANESYAPGKFEHHDMLLRKNWRKCQRLTDLFWKRWIREYLPTLTRRTKWFEKVDPVKCGDVVLIVDENLPRYSWPRGIIINTVTSKDGQVRRATVQTTDGIYERPVVKLVVLGVNDEESEKDDDSCFVTEGGNVANKSPM